MNFTIDLAKTYFRYSSSDATDIEQALTNALRSAESRFLSYIKVNEYKRYVNFTNPITATSKDSDNITFNYDSSVNEIKENDLVLIDSILFDVVSVDTDKFVIDKEYSGSSLEVSNKTMLIYEDIFAWFVQLVFLMTDQQLFLNLVLQKEESFSNEGGRTVAFDAISWHENRINKSIDDQYSSIKTNQPIVYLGRA